MTKVFISYSHIDDIYRKELEKHLSVLKKNGYIDTWTDSEIIAGEDWSNEISRELEEAKVILLLISSDFLASNYCYDVEMKRAIERHHKKEAIVVPIILRFCDWSNTPFSKLQSLPLNARPVRDWSDQDYAFLNIVDGIKALLTSLDNTKQDSFLDHKILSPKEQFSQIYQKVLYAENDRELRKAMFTLNEYKKTNPITFEVQELEDRIKMGIEYETRPMMRSVLSEKRMASRGGTFFWIILVIAIIVISFVVYVTIRLL